MHRRVRFCRSELVAVRQAWSATLHNWTASTVWRLANGIRALLRRLFRTYGPAVDLLQPVKPMIEDTSTSAAPDLLWLLSSW